MTKESEFQLWWGQEFSFHHVVQTNSGILGALFLEVNEAGREANHSPPANAEFKETWFYKSTLPNFFMTQCLIS
jgi:hypothetical protein